MKKEFMIIGGILVLIVVIIFTSLSLSFNEREYIATVTDKDRITTGSGERIESKYLIFTKNDDGEVIVFENTDNWFRGKIASSDLQGKLEIGLKYKFTVVGVRIPLISMYENVIEAEEVKQ